MVSRMTSGVLSARRRNRRIRRPRSRVVYTLPQLLVPSGSGPASLQIEAASFELQSLRLVGAIRGVVPLFAAARNGPGTGRLSSHRDGRWLKWQAPGASRYGRPVACGADGEYVLRDADDPDKYVRVRVIAAELVSGVVTSTVELSDVYNNALAGDDVTAAEAAAGSVESWTLTLRNVSRAILSQLRVWIDRNTVDLEISDNGSGWVAPTDESTGLSLGDLLIGSTTTLYVRRSIAAGAIAHGGLLNCLHFIFRS